MKTVLSEAQTAAGGGAEAHERALTAIEAAARGPSPDETPIERVEGAERRVLLLCDHASPRTPAALGDLGLPPGDLERHIAYDVGARGVTLGLAALMRAPALMASFSRLVIDPNRGERDPTLIMRLYDRSVVPANRAVDAAERERRLNAYHRPYRRAVEAAATNAERALGAPPLLVAIHSFTPALRGRPRRPWHVGVLWDSDPATAQELLARLRACGDLIIGDNEPYKGSLPGDMMWTLGGARRPHALIEIRNDLIEEPRAQAAWAARLAPILLQIGASSDGATAASRRDLATTPPHAGASPSVGALVNQHAPEPARADASWDDASWDDAAWDDAALDDAAGDDCAWDDGAVRDPSPPASGAKEPFE